MMSSAVGWMEEKVITLIRGFLLKCELLKARDSGLNAIFCLIMAELLHMGRENWFAGTGFG